MYLLMILKIKVNISYKPNGIRVDVKETNMKIFCNQRKESAKLRVLRALVLHVPHTLHALLLTTMIGNLDKKECYYSVFFHK